MGWLNHPPPPVISLPQYLPAFPNRKPPPRGKRLRAWSLCRCRNWGLVGRLCWQPAPKAGIIFRLKKTNGGGWCFFVFVVLFLCVVGWESNPICVSFCLLLLVFFVVFFCFSLVGKAKQKHQHVQPSGNIYILLILYRGCNTTHSGSVGCCFLCWENCFLSFFFWAGVFWRKLGGWWNAVFFSRCGRDFSWILEMLEQKQTMGIQMANKTQKAERVQV